MSVHDRERERVREIYREIRFLPICICGALLSVPYWVEWWFGGSFGSRLIIVTLPFLYPTTTAACINDSAECGTCNKAKLNT